MAFGPRSIFSFERDYSRFRDLTRGIAGRYFYSTEKWSSRETNATIGRALKLIKLAYTSFAKVISATDDLSGQISRGDVKLNPVSG